MLGLSEGGGQCEEFEPVPRESSLSINGEGKIEGATGSSGKVIIAQRV